MVHDHEAILYDTSWLTPLKYIVFNYFHCPANFMSDPLARLCHHSKWRTLEEARGSVALGREFFYEGGLLLIKRWRPALIRRKPTC